MRLGRLKDRNWSIMACSAIDGKGVNEGMDWLVVCFQEMGTLGRNVLTNTIAANGWREFLKLSFHKMCFLHGVGGAFTGISMAYADAPLTFRDVVTSTLSVCSAGLSRECC